MNLVIVKEIIWIWNQMDKSKRTCVVDLAYSNLKRPNSRSAESFQDHCWNNLYYIAKKTLHHDHPTACWGMCVQVL